MFINGGPEDELDEDDIKFIVMFALAMLGLVIAIAALVLAAVAIR